MRVFSTWSIDWSKNNPNDCKKMSKNEKRKEKWNWKEKKERREMEKRGLNWKKKKIIHYLSNFLPDIYIFLSFWLFCDFLYFVLFFNNRPFIKKIVQFRLKNIYMQIFFISKEGKNWIRTLERVWKSSVLSKVLSHANGKRIHHEENALLAEQKNFKEKGETKHGVHCIRINRIISTLFKGWRSMDH